MDGQRLFSCRHLTQLFYCYFIFRYLLIIFITQQFITELLLSKHWYPLKINVLPECLKCYPSEILRLELRQNILSRKLSNIGFSQKKLLFSSLFSPNFRENSKSIKSNQLYNSWLVLGIFDNTFFGFDKVQCNSAFVSTVTILKICIIYIYNST